MKNTCYFLILLMLGFTWLLPWGTAAYGENLLTDAEGKWSLDHWNVYHHEPIARISDVWQIEKGILTCAGLPRGYLHSKETYTDFVLTLQWRWPEGSEPGKGGVLFRMTGDHKVWPKCLEVQLNVGDEGDFVGIDGYQLDGPADRLSKIDHPQFGKIIFLKKTAALAKPAGQWNTVKIEARGSNVTQWLNGKKVNQAKGCDVVAGPILLTAENNRIQFRDIQLTPLDGDRNEK